MADTATTDHPKPTVASAYELAQQAQDSAQLAHQVGEKLAEKLPKLDEQVLALTRAVSLMSGRVDKNTETAAGLTAFQSKMDGLSARLETIEQRTQGETGDWAPVISALDERIRKHASDTEGRIAHIQTGVDGLAKLVATDTVNPVHTEFGPAFADLKGAVDEVGDRLIKLEDQPSAYGDLLTRLESLEHQLTRWDRIAGAAPGGNTASAKVLELMRMIPAIGKEQDFESKTARFKFRGVDQAMDATGHAMREVGLTIRTKVLGRDTTQDTVVKQGNSGSYEQLWTTTILTMQYVFVDPVTGHEHPFEMVGEGRDVGDKSSSKAAAMACKYALFQALMIPVAGLNDTDSDSEQPVIEGNRRDTPGRQVSQGRMTPAQAVQEYTQRGYNGDAAGSDGPPSEDTLMQKAAKAAHFLRQAQAEPAEVALPAILKAKDRVAEYGIGGYQVSLSADGSDKATLDQMINAALQLVNATVNRSAGAQGLSREAQQAGEGTRAAAGTPSLSDEPPWEYEGSEQEYLDALRAMGETGAPADVLRRADQIVQAWEAKHP
jgi:hypothetical protein